MVAVVYRDDRDSEQGENAGWKADADKSAGIYNHPFLSLYIHIDIYK
jgi:hypothetical protein